ncbi:MAG: META domain-containing protein [Corynebacterium sp.]|uniref:META domain-containing protein n=1 Tax=Corynebacterium TaxID=1716 RepID=UPI0026489C37|nr:META domain-containing protein [Corynebacterium sp.]MDN5581868.1 META domain-containing protein [Corynebacterium sp.]MDN5719154.1 META domain-containing protein [Corynebacterium sp.]
MTLTRKILTGAMTAATTAALVGFAGAPAATAEPVQSSLPDAPFSGTWVDVDPTGAAELTFDDGRISGTDGCNGVASSYTVDGNVAEVEPFASTLMACPGPTSDWLQGAASVHHYGALLVVHDEDGGVLGALRPEI